MKKLNEDVVRNTIRKDIVRLTLILDIVSKVKPILDKFNGKQITKTFTSTCQEALKEYCVKLDCAVGTTYLEVFHKDPHHDLSYNNRMRMLIGYSILDMEKVKSDYAVNFYNG